MENQQQNNQETRKLCKEDLLYSLFGQEIALGLLNNNSINQEIIKQTCPHPVFVEKICTKCGQENNGMISTIPFWYIYPKLNLSSNEIIRICDSNFQTLITQKKLHLVLDLDHTLVHTRKFYKLSPEDRTFLRSKKYGVDYNVHGDLCTLYKMSCAWTKLRPFVRTFLLEASKMFDMTIYTLGCKTHAWNCVKLLDPYGKYFDNWRVISRDDCVVLDKHKKFLDVILEHEKVVLIMDDNREIWDDHKSNLLKIQPYNFFSYFSLEDKVRDASPPKDSWSQMNGDESEENGVLARVLEIIRNVHAEFYDDDGKGDYASKDVRQILQRVLVNHKSLSKKQKKRIDKKVS